MTVLQAVMKKYGLSEKEALKLFAARKVALSGFILTNPFYPYSDKDKNLLVDLS